MRVIVPDECPVAFLPFPAETYSARSNPGARASPAAGAAHRKVSLPGSLEAQAGEDNRGEDGRLSEAELQIISAPRHSSNPIACRTSSGLQHLSSFLDRGLVLGDCNLSCPDEMAVRPQKGATKHRHPIFPAQPQGRGQRCRPRENTLRRLAARSARAASARRRSGSGGGAWLPGSHEPSRW
jgi:hypothetical protein